ncbi:hypothetical protein [Flavobacterium sp. MK4S-17]|uniref:hypothetical protein n=1 Tax=Flavobacterium sp. MK4S-17 TaxID=2543737 RepID=UPI00135A5B78|nr:hypothetical protein [Flavobacterium sp. MK4S-17]
MKYYINILLLLYCNIILAQDKEAYLNDNKWDITKPFTFTETNARLIGFGAYHGSAKTEDAELALVASLCKNNGLRYYVAETDMAIACFLNEYLKSGDEVLLKDLIIHYGTRIPQERTVEVFEKWRKLKKINDALPENKKLTVIGPDPVVTYKYYYRLLLTLIKDKEWHKAKQLQNTVITDTTDYSPYYNSFSKKQLSGFVTDYEINKAEYLGKITDREKFEDVITLLKTSFRNYNREKEIYNNYIKLYNKYNLQNELVFARYGFFHLLKAKEGNAASFFTQLLENNIYNNESLISIIGYFNKSEVIWDDIFKDGEYSYSTTSVEGTGDSGNEYFSGIDAFKKQKMSDLTLFRLDSSNSPYSKSGCIDLIQVITPEKSAIDYNGQTTTSFIDYALLISNSKAAKSIFTLP